jgi:hypothetical protein
MFNINPAQYIKVNQNPLPDFHISILHKLSETLFLILKLHVQFQNPAQYIKINLNPLSDFQTTLPF